VTRTFTFPPGAFDRLDEEDDRLFYSFPRRVVHIDDGAIETLGQLYAALVPPGGSVLDLMASWRSHLPASFAGRVVGLGLNQEEMVDNPQLAEAIVHDLNRDPRLPLADGVFDAALCAVSVQYLTRPLEVFRDVRRVLRPAAPFVVAFSNRCFPEKAVALWRATTDEQHVTLVELYFAAADGFTEVARRAFVPAQGDPLFAVWAARAESTVIPVG
jgi:SAM-dependent methyltransferase